MWVEEGYGYHLSLTAPCQESLTHAPWISTDCIRAVKILEENCDRDDISCDIYLGKLQPCVRQFYSALPL